MLTLRPYQEATIRTVCHDWNRHSDVLATLATGAGKTVIFLELINRLFQADPNHRALVLAHRRNLVSQPQERVSEFWPELAPHVGVVMANQNEAHSRLIVASKQTLENPARLEGVLSHGQIDSLIIDEAHRAAANGYRAIIDSLRETNPNLKHLGVTATPERADDRCLTEVYPHESVHYGTKELVDLGWLVEPEIRGVLTRVSLEDVRVEGSGHRRDYNQRQLANVFDTDNCFDLVVQSHKEYADGRPAIAFTTSVAGAHRLAEMLTNANIPALAVDGSTPQGERDAAVEAVKAGDCQVLCNCGVYTEGFDLPMLEICHIVRPTRSDGLWLQMAGRVLRLSEGKNSALILDYQPEERNVDIRLQQRTESIGGRFPASGNERDGDGEPLPANTIGTGQGVEYVVLNYFDESDSAWIGSDDGWQVMALGEGRDGIDRSIALSPPGEKMALWVVWKRKGQKRHMARKYIDGDFHTVSDVAEELIAKHARSWLTDRSAGWRNQPATEGQLSFVRRIRMHRPGMSKGEASGIIARWSAMNALRRYGAI